MKTAESTSAYEAIQAQAPLIYPDGRAAPEYMPHIDSDVGFVAVERRAIRERADADSMPARRVTAAVAASLVVWIEPSRRSGGGEM